MGTKQSIVHSSPRHSRGRCCFSDNASPSSTLTISRVPRHEARSMQAALTGPPFLSALCRRLVPFAQRYQGLTFCACSLVHSFPSVLVLGWHAGEAWFVPHRNVCPLRKCLCMSEVLADSALTCTEFLLCFVFCFQGDQGNSFSLCFLRTLAGSVGPWGRMTPPFPNPLLSLRLQKSD